MADITITFAQQLNTSLQAKPAASGGSALLGHDIIYFIRSGQTSIKRIGKCVALDQVSKTITVATDSNTTPTPVAGDFIFFNKDTEIGTSGLDGYFAKVEMKNILTTEAELFAVGSDVVESSK